MNSKIDDIYKFLESAGDNHVSAKKVLEYLDVLQLRQFGQKHHDHRLHERDEIADEVIHFLRIKIREL